MRKSRLSRFLRLPPAERSAALQAWVLLPAVALALRGLGTARVLRFLDAQKPAPRRRGPGSARVRELVAAAARCGPLSRNCLRESIVLLYLLRRRGFEPQLRFGVRKEHSRLEAHAWVEVDGGPLTGAGEDPRRYSAFPSPVPTSGPAS